MRLIQLPNLAPYQVRTLDESLRFDDAGLPVLLPVPLATKRSLDEVAAMPSQRGMKAAYAAFVENARHQWAHDTLKTYKDNLIVERQNTVLSVANADLTESEQATPLRIHEPYPAERTFDNFDEWLKAVRSYRDDRQRYLIDNLSAEKTFEKSAGDSIATVVELLSATLPDLGVDLKQHPEFTALLKVLATAKDKFPKPD